MRRKVFVKGRIYRPPYEGYINFHLRDDETEEEAIARTLRQTSFPDGVRVGEVKILDESR